MAETDTATAPDAQEQYIQQMLRQLQGGPPQVATGGRARTEQPSSFVGLLGSALGGGPSGAVPMSADEADASGKRALLNFGLSMLANSGYSTQPRTFGQIVAQGIGGAQQSLGQSEALTAARGQAQQDYAAQQQELQIARIKEALPLLNLQDQIRRAKAAEGLLGGGSGGPPSIGAAGASAEVPAELMPHYAAASRETGIPVAVLIAKDKQESGFNNAQPGGIAQVLPSTAAAPGFGLPPISQAELADPGQNIRFGARYLKARGDAAGVKDWNNPAEFSKALLAYNGGGDKNYVANVLRYYKPGGAPAAAPAAPSARQPIPATDASGGATAEAAPAPGRAQFAGPGAPPDAVAPPPSPGAAGNADAIASGMIARGADPATLAPSGRGVTADEVTAAAAGPAAPTDAPVVPAPPPPTVAQAAAPVAQALQPDITLGNGGIIRHPGTPADFRARNYQPPPTTEDFNPNLTEAENAAFAAKRAALANNRKLISTLPRDKVPEAVQSVLQQEQALNAEYQTALQAKRLKADANVTAWNQKQDESLKPLYQDAVKSYDTAVQANLAHTNDIETKVTEGEQARLTGAAASENSYVLDQRKQFAADHDATRNALGDYSMLRMFSDAAGKSTPIDNLQIGDKTGRDILTQWGLGTQAQREQWGAQQAFNAVINKSILAARAGVSMGQLSDRDLNFLQHMTVSQLQDPQTRSDIISYLEQNAYRKKAYMDRVEQLWDGGKGLTWGNARMTAEKEFEAPDRDIVPRVPADWKTLAPELKQQFLDDNHMKPGSLARLPNGKLSRYGVLPGQ